MLDVSDLTITAGGRELVHPLSFSLAPGQRLGLIGESGSGKSLTALAILGLLGPGVDASGSIRLDGQELLGRPDRALRPLRGAVMAMIFQEPMSALDPLMRVGRQLDRAGAHPEEALTEVGLAPGLAQRYPHQLSGGQRQRVLIAMAMARRPRLLICDEPTTALDATTQDGILDLLEEVATQHGTALLFISHDLRVIARLCSEVMVLQAGQMVESGPTERILRTPQHPYTQRLVAAARPAPPALPGPQLSAGSAAAPAIELRGVERAFGGGAGVAGIDLAVARGERLGLVGGSGSGKSTLLRLIAGLDQPTGGQLRVDGRVQMVFQDPNGSLNPRLPVWKSVAEGLRTLPAADRPPRAERKDRAISALEQVGIPAAAAGRFPHEFSGGQRQRISIARAIIGRPDILLADEAVSALDVSVRTQVLALLEELVGELGLTLVFVTHDLAVMRQLCPTVAIISDGQLVEHGPTARVLAAPAHPYTRALVAAAQLP